MSEEDNKPKPPAKPTTKTSTVPLKKETVRITLKAKPGAGATPPAPAAPKPPAPAPPAPRPPAPAPPAGAPAPPAPPRPPGGAPPPPSGAKTVPLTPAGPPSAPAPPPPPPAGAKTVPLTQAPSPSGPAVGQPTARLQPGPPPGAPAPGTRPLPKATVKLAPTQPLASSPTASVASAPIKGGVASQVIADDEAEEESGIMPFAIICLVLAVAVLALNILTSERVMVQDKDGNPSVAVPERRDPYHSKTSGTSTFKNKVPEIPIYAPEDVRDATLSNGDGVAATTE